MSVRFSPQAEKKFTEIMNRYPKHEAALLPVLWLAQEEFGPLTQEISSYVAEKVGVSLSRVESVLSFYTLYETRAAGKHPVQICRNISCRLRGADSLMDCMQKDLNVQEGETTTDGEFTYSTVECLGACGGAPAIQIHTEYHENVGVTDLQRMIGRLRGSSGKDH